jgi:hypothetical protein
MARFCLPHNQANAFLQAFKSGDLDAEKLIAAGSSQKRREMFAKVVGEVNAKEVNAQFEAALISRQRKALMNWLQRTGGLDRKLKKTLAEKINGLKEVLSPEEGAEFLEDLAAYKLKVAVTPEEAKKITTLANDVQEAKNKIKPDSPVGSKDRLDYGLRSALLNEYVGELKLAADKVSAKEWLVSPSRWLNDVGGSIKSIIASLDNSFYGRQGIKVLFTNPDIWVKDFLKSWRDIGRALKGADATLAIKSDVYSRPNALNGKYDSMKIDIGLSPEEAFPSSLPGRIPLLGRLYRASEAAFNGGALRMRADLADRVIAVAEKQGVDVLDPKQGVGLGKLVNSMTGRGDIGKLGSVGREVNILFFAIKFVKSNFDTLTAHITDKSVSPYAKKKAAGNLLKIAAGISAVLWTAEQLHPGAVDWDPRSANFGKIKIGNTRFDITGGMGSLATLASRITPTKHEGQWGFYSKSSTSNKVNKLNSGKFGSQTVVDVIDNYWQGKLSPIAGLFRDIWKGENFRGEKPTPANVAKSFVTPITAQTYMEAKKTPGAADPLVVLIADALGFGANTYAPKEKEKK